MNSELICLKWLTVAFFACAGLLQAAEVTVSSPDSPMLGFALGKLEAALKQQASTLKHATDQRSEKGATIAVKLNPVMMATLGAEGFQRTRSSQGLQITACDERGAMYGVLDIAELILTGTPMNKISDLTIKPRYKFRAIKFNLPWSAYRTSPSLEQQQETCKDIKQNKP